MTPLESMQGEDWLKIRAVIRKHSARRLSEELADDVALTALAEIHDYLTQPRARPLRPAKVQFPTYDPEEVIPGGVVFSDIATKTYVDIDGNKVCTKMDRLKDGDKWQDVLPRVRARYTSDLTKDEPGWTYVEPPEVVKGQWEDDGGAPGGAPGAVEVGTPPEDPVRDELVARDAQGNYLGTVERDVVGDDADPGYTSILEHKPQVDQGATWPRQTREGLADDIKSDLEAGKPPIGKYRPDGGLQGDF